MRVVVKGDKVKVNYKGILDDGEIFDESEEGKPLEFTVGAEEVIDGFDNALIGMQVNETKQVEFGFEEGYGEYDEDMIIKVPVSEFPEDGLPEEGETITVPAEDGDTMELFVSEITDEFVILDGNHPLAGEDLTFEITLLEIVD